jgi:hypothetical protein
VIVSEQAKSLVIHPAPNHGLSFKNLEFRRPFWAGNSELFVSLFGLVLTGCQFAVYEELPGVVIRSLGAVWKVVFDRN